MPAGEEFRRLVDGQSRSGFESAEVGPIGSLLAIGTELHLDDPAVPKPGTWSATRCNFVSVKSEDLVSALNHRAREVHAG